MAQPLTSITVEVEKLVYGGDGLARANGQVLLLPFVLPGERVTAQVSQSKKGLLRGSPVAILEPEEARVIPRCEYFGNCGGCHYQHADYAFQLEQKCSILRETLQRLGGIHYTGEIHTISAEPWNYRNRIQVHFDGRDMGFRKTSSHHLCPIDHCHISSPVLNETIAKLRTATGEPDWPRFLRSLEIFTNESDVQLNVVDARRPIAVRFFEWCKGFLPKLAADGIEYAAVNYQFRISRGSFFQVNRFLVDALVREGIGVKSGAYAVDLYAGVGLFSLPLSERFERVDAVEHGGPAFRDLQLNAGRGATNVRTIRASTEEFLRTASEQPDLLVADPPRAGIGKEAAQEILRVRPARIALISCDPATLARDLKTLLCSYEIERLVMVDLFPQTYHFETIVHLTAR